MRDEKRERPAGDGVRAEPAEPAKMHGDVLDDLIPRDLREAEPRSVAEPRSEAESGATRERGDAESNQA